jgi:hypothetical protein
MSQKNFWKLRSKRKYGSTYTEAYQEGEPKVAVTPKRIDFAIKKLIVEDSDFWEKNKKDMITA